MKQLKKNNTYAYRSDSSESPMLLNDTHRVHNEAGGQSLLQSEIDVTSVSATREDVLPATSASFTILVVDDDSFIRDLSTEILQRDGVQVIKARDGVDALDVFKQHGDAISLVLSDIDMPRMNGFGLHDNLRSASDVFFLFMSGRHDEKHHVSELGDARVSFLCKPFLPADLLDAVHGALGEAYVQIGSEHSELGTV